MIGSGATIFGCEGPVLRPQEAAFFRDFDPFGFIIFGFQRGPPARGFGRARYASRHFSEQK